MKECTDHIQRFSTANDRKIKKVCEPLNQTFGIEAFWYYTLSADGYFSFIGNQGQIAEFFSDHKLYVGHPFYRHPKFFNNGAYFEQMHEGGSIKQQALVRESYGLSQLFTLLQKEENDLIHGFGFGTLNPNQNLTFTYLNQQELLKSFVSYFCEEMQDLIQKIEDNKVHIAPHCGQSFYQSAPLDTVLSPSKAGQFLQRINKSPLPIEMYQSLSSREMECLAWLLKGQTARQMGEHLYLSARTVEGYLENIKNKLGCKSKTEIFTQAMLMKELGLF